MKKREILTIKIDKIAFPNKGIGYFEGQKVVVKNTIPGQIVKVQITGKKGGIAQARLLEVEQEAVAQIEPLCPHFMHCGGCTYQNLSYGAELELKKGQVLELLEQAGIREFQFEGIVPSLSSTQYRNKCEFSFGDEEKGGALALGMRKRQSYYEVVNLTHCTIVDTDYLKIIACNVSFFRQEEVPFYHKARHDGILRHLVVRKSKSSGEILINIVTTGKYLFPKEKYVQALLALSLEGRIGGVLHTINDSVADVVQSDATTLLYGKDYMTEVVFDLQFKITPFSFFQTNSEGAQVLYSMVRDFAGDCRGKVVFDLYCGTGTIGQIMAQKSKFVVGIEIVEEAAKAANENAQSNGLSNCLFIAGDVLKEVERLTQKPDLIIVDPPRDGIHPKAIQKIMDFNAPQILYISCKPTSLVRDLKLMEERGYKAMRIGIVDMFPRTVHIEVVIQMTYCGDKAKNKD